MLKYMPHGNYIKGFIVYGNSVNCPTRVSNPNSRADTVRLAFPESSVPRALKPAASIRLRKLASPMPISSKSPALCSR